MSAKRTFLLHSASVSVNGVESVLTMMTQEEIIRVVAEKIRSLSHGDHLTVELSGYNTEARRVWE